MVVQPFKKGPDYIDPSWLSAAADRSCRNLDSFLMPEEIMLNSFRQACHGVDFVLVEGAMGLFDGLDPDMRGSSAEVARRLGTPIILVVNTARMTSSIAAMVSGYQRFEPDTNIAGVILNSVSGSRHESKLLAALERYCGIPAVGVIPRDTSLNMGERHLGLVPFREAEQSSSIIERICQKVEGCLNLDGILSIARSAAACSVAQTGDSTGKPGTVRMGVMLDRAFHFYYPENLEALCHAGAELVFINSLNDRHLPDIQGLYIGGGFPELFAEELEANSGLRHDIAEAVEGGLPVYAECGGLMYLCRGIKWLDQWHEMVGAIPAEVEMYQRPQGHGYVELETTDVNPLFPAGLRLRGHEFHHSRLVGLSRGKFAYRVRRGRGIDGEVDGVAHHNLLASFTHLHALGVPQWAEAFVSLSETRSRGELAAASS